MSHNPQAPTKAPREFKIYHGVTCDRGSRGSDDYGNLVDQETLVGDNEEVHTIELTPSVKLKLETHEELVIELTEHFHDLIEEHDPVYYSRIKDLLNRARGVK